MGRSGCPGPKRGCGGSGGEEEEEDEEAEEEFKPPPALSAAAPLAFGTLVVFLSCFRARSLIL